MNLTRCFRAPALTAFLALFVAGCFDEVAAPLQVGTKAPPFKLELISGGQADMEAPHGNGHVITFMSSWCPCSNESIPLIKEAHQRFAKQDIAFLLVGIQDPESKFDAFVEKWQLPFPAGYDEGNEIARAYGVSAPPTTIFVDRDGLVKRVFYGNIKDKQGEFLEWTNELL